MHSPATLSVFGNPQIATQGSGLVVLDARRKTSPHGGSRGDGDGVLYASPPAAVHRLKTVLDRSRVREGPSLTAVVTLAPWHE